MFPLFSLSTDLLNYLFRFFRPNEKLQVSLVCKKFHELIRPKFRLIVRFNSLFESQEQFDSKFDEVLTKFQNKIEGFRIGSTQNVIAFIYIK